MVITATILITAACDNDYVQIYENEIIEHTYYPEQIEVIEGAAEPDLPQITRFFSALPNTGLIVSWDIDYVTDQYGRALNEFPTKPQYFNREGMDALETVLQMIEEMDM